MKRFALALALTTSLSAHAEMVAAPDQAALQKCGEAKLSVLFWEVYESSLYTPTGAYEQGTRPLRLEIRYLRDIRGGDLVKQTKKEWDAQGLAHPNQSTWLARLTELWPDVSEDDVIALHLDDRNISRFTLNGETIGTIEDPDFGEQFAAIWLSPNTTRPELRQALIGEG